MGTGRTAGLKLYNPILGTPIQSATSLALAKAVESPVKKKINQHVHFLSPLLALVQTNNSARLPSLGGYISHSANNNLQNRSSILSQQMDLINNDQPCLSDISSRVPLVLIIKNEKDRRMKEKEEKERNLTTGSIPFFRGSTENISFVQQFWGGRGFSSQLHDIDAQFLFESHLLLPLI